MQLRKKKYKYFHVFPKSPPLKMERVFCCSFYAQIITTTPSAFNLCHKIIFLYFYKS